MSKFCFVIMPFDPNFDEIYHLVIKQTLKEMGWQCQRVDELPDPSHITKDIVDLTEKANLVIADLTDRNPNVFYELAIAHALKKPTIMLTQKMEYVPFDLQEYRVIIYEQSIKGGEKLRKELQLILSKIAEGKIRSSNPIVDNLTISPLHVTVSTDEVLSIEKDAIEQVWVLAPDIELGPRYFVDVMHTNITKKGINYKYLVAELPIVKDNLLKLVRLLDLGNRSHLFEYRFADSHIIESDVTIIDPNTLHENAFILAPCEAPFYHFKVLGSHLFRLKERFIKLWNDAKEG